jgi:hypothetical protein
MSLEPIIDLIDGATTLLAWSYDDKSLSLEIFEDGHAEWFFCDRNNNITLGSNNNDEKFDSKLFIEYLLKFKDE